MGNLDSTIEQFLTKMPEGIQQEVIEKAKSITELSSDQQLDLDCETYNQKKGNLVGYDCDVCLNRGWSMAPDYKNNTIFMRECKCSSKRKSQRQFENSGLSGLIDRYTFESYETTEPWQESVKESALEFAGNQKDHWFYIGGQVGSGKTHLCTAIVGEFLKQGISCRYMLWRDDVVGIRSNVNDDAEYYRLMNPLKTVPVLYIDDFFKIPQSSRNPTVGDMNIAFELLNYRYNNNLTTIISSEHTAERIVEFEEAVGSRILQRCGKYALTIGKNKERNYRLTGGLTL